MPAKADRIAAGNLCEIQYSPAAHNRPESLPEDYNDDFQLVMIHRCLCNDGSWRCTASTQEKSKERKRYLVIDPQGHVKSCQPQRMSSPTTAKRGEKFEGALTRMNGPIIEIINCPDNAEGFILVTRG